MSDKTAATDASNRPKFVPVIEFNSYVDKEVRVKFIGGREVTGILKGWDHLVNLVLDDAIEYLRDPLDHSVLTDKTRKLGRIVCRSTSVCVLAPTDGMAEISNPFVQEQQ